jgi:hypothetical protein
LSGGLSVKKLDYKYEVTNMKNGGGGDFKICFTTCTKVSAIFCHKKKQKKVLSEIELFKEEKKTIIQFF